MGATEPVGLTIYGSGKVAQALTRALKPHTNIYLSTPQTERGKNIARMLNITFTPYDSPPPTRHIIIARRDGDIKQTARHIAHFGQDFVVLHTSGALPSDIIPLPHRGSLHPIRSITETTDLTSTTFVFEGSPEAEKLASWIAEVLGSRIFTIEPESKLIYHAALALMSQSIGTSTILAMEILKELGISGIQDALFQLGTSALNNALIQGINGLTGPAARGDIELVQKEANALEDPAGKLYQLVSDIVVLLKGKG